MGCSLNAQEKRTAINASDVTKKRFQHQPGRDQRTMLLCLCFIAKQNLVHLASHLQNVSLTRHSLVENRIDEESQEQPGHQSSHNYDSERLLCV